MSVVFVNENVCVVLFGLCESVVYGVLCWRCVYVSVIHRMCRVCGWFGKLRLRCGLCCCGSCSGVCLFVAVVVWYGDMNRCCLFWYMAVRVVHVVLMIVCCAYVLVFIFYINTACVYVIAAL